LLQILLLVIGTFLFGFAGLRLVGNPVSNFVLSRAVVVGLVLVNLGIIFLSRKNAVQAKGALILLYALNR